MGDFTANERVEADAVPASIAVEVAYALPHRQLLLKINVPRGTTALEAVRQSRIDEEFPEADLLAAPMGLYGQAFGTKGLAAKADYVLDEGDRVEIYRPLAADPKAARKRRAANPAGGTSS